MARMRTALSELVIEGVKTNRELHLRILNDPDFCAGGAHIHHLEARLNEWYRDV